METLPEIITWIVGVEKLSDISSGYATLLSLMFAIIAGLSAFGASIWRSKREFQREKIFEFLAANKKSVMKSIHEFSSAAAEDKANEVKIQYTRDNFSKFMKVSTHFETAAVHVSTGFASEKVIFLIEGGNLARFFEYTGPYIKKVQEKVPKALIHYEGLYLRYTYGNQKWYELPFCTPFSIFFNLLYFDKILAYRKAFLCEYAIVSHFYNYSKNYIEHDKTDIKFALYPFRALINLISLLCIFLVIRIFGFN